MSCGAHLWTARADRVIPDEHRCELSDADNHDWHRCHCRFEWSVTFPHLAADADSEAP